MGPTNPRLMTVSQTAELLGITNEGVRHLVKIGELPVAVAEGDTRVSLYFGKADVRRLVRRRLTAREQEVAVLREALEALA